MEYIKDFISWFKIKKNLNEKNKDCKENIRYGEIRWVSIGVNIGSEIDGKGNDFARPCLILHVSGKDLVLIAPITSKNKKIPGSFPFIWGKNAEHKDFIYINQIRTISKNRILKRCGKISENKIKYIKNILKNFYKLD